MQYKASSLKSARRLVKFENCKKEKGSHVGKESLLLIFGLNCLISFNFKFGFPFPDFLKLVTF